MTAQRPGPCPHFRRHQQQGKCWEEEGTPAPCPVPLSQTAPSWVGQKMENIFNQTRWEEAGRLSATSGLEEPALSCSGCFWGGCPLPSSNKSHRFLGAEQGRGGPPKQSTAWWGVAGRAGRSVRGELRDGQQGTWQEDLAGNGDLRSTASCPWAQALSLRICLALGQSAARQPLRI